MHLFMQLVECSVCKLFTAVCGQN